MNNLTNLPASPIIRLSNVPHYTYYTQIRAIISYFSIHELGYRGSDVAKALNLSRASVSKSKSRGKNLIERNQHLWDLLKAS